MLLKITSHLTENTTHIYYKVQLVKAVNRIISIYSEDHTKPTNTLRHPSGIL